MCEFYVLKKKQLFVFNKHWNNSVLQQRFVFVQPQLKAFSIQKNTNLSVKS